jgi:hypothetical protein
METRQPVPARKGDSMIDPPAEVKRQTTGAVANARNQHAIRQQGGTHAPQQRELLGMIDIVKYVQNYDDIRSTDVERADITNLKFCTAIKCPARARDVLRH